MEKSIFYFTENIRLSIMKFSMPMDLQGNCRVYSENNWKS